MYYADDLIEEVRSRNLIQDVAGQYVHLTKKGGNYFGLCPFHNEKTGSFSVSPSKQIYHCFGCGAGGNVLTFIMNYENVSFGEAMEILAKRAGIDLPKQEYTPKQREEADLRTRLLENHKEAALYYHRILRSEDGALGYRYFRNRGLTNETMISFGLGYTGQHPDGLYRFLKGKGYSDDLLKESGLVTITEKGGRDKFWNRVMFPIMDPGNRVIGFGGRVLGQGEPKYLNSTETKLFDKSRNLYVLNAARKTKEKYFIICEGYMDVIALHQAGFTNSVAALGTAFTERHGAILKRYTEDVILCFDSDGAGRKAALRAIPIFRSQGIRMKVLSMDPCKDPDEFIKTYGADEFRKRIDAAENAFLFEVRLEREKFDFQNPDDKALFFSRTAKMLAGFQDEIERNSYVEAVSKKYGIDYGLLKKRTEEYGNQIGLTERTETSAEPKKTVQSLGKSRDSGIKEAEKLILTYLTENPEAFGFIRSQISPEDFSGETASQVAKELYAALERGSKTVNPAAIMNRFLNDDRYQEVADLFSSNYGEDLSDDERERALREALKKVRLDALEAKIRETTDPVKLMELLRKKQELK